MPKNNQICVNCVHWEFHAGTPDWTERTPGEGWSMECKKKHYSIWGCDTTEDQFRKAMLTATDCDDFTRREG